MQVKRNDLTPEIARKIDSLPLEELERVLGVEPVSKQTSGPQLSRWAEYAKKAPAPLNGASEDIMKSSKEFREDFAFKHDLSDDE